MRIITSPAKKMKVDTDSLPYRDLPVFLPKTEELCRKLQNQIEDPEQIKSFDRLNYRFDAARSDENTFVFVLR